LRNARQLVRIADDKHDDDLAWADAVNALPHRDDTDAAYPALREQFNETEIAELVMSLPRSGVGTF
jgi:alkylhydroperoxidase family enzyme